MIPVLSTLLLTLHLLALNIAAAGPLICCWLQLRRRVGGEVYGEAGKRLVWASIAALILGSLFGLGLLVCVRLDNDASYWNTLARFPAEAYWNAVVELAFSLFCLLVYAATWNRLASRPWLHGLIALLSSTNLIYHFPLLMSAIAEIAARPELVIEDVITRPLVREVMFRPSVLSMAVHFSLASLAVAGVALMLIARPLSGVQQQDGRNSDVAINTPSPAARVIAIGGRIALIVSAVQLLTGFWVVFQSSPIARRAMMGGDVASTCLIVAGLIGALGLLHALVSVALGDTSTNAVWRSTFLLLAVVLLMTGLLVRTRRLASHPAAALSPASLRIEGRIKSALEIRRPIGPRLSRCANPEVLFAVAVCRNR